MTIRDEMESILVFKDLFAYADRSLGWLQVFRTGPAEGMVLVTEPSDNPGQSAVNSAERLSADIESAFGGLGAVRIFVRFIDDPRGPGWIELIRDAEEIVFERLGVEAVGALCGGAIEPGSPIHDYSCAGLAGHSHPLLALVPDPEIERNPLDDMAVAAVADLPWAHNPSRCAHADRFQAIESTYPATGFDTPAVGAHWFLTLTERDFQSCRYHEADWLRVAATSVDLFQRKPESATLDVLLEAVAGEFGHAPENELCASLFADPIVWRPGHTSVTDGQHRTCALKAAGAPFCVVDVDGGYIEEPAVGDPRRRASAEIAQFWARRAADSAA